MLSYIVMSIVILIPVVYYFKGFFIKENFEEKKTVVNETKQAKQAVVNEMKQAVVNPFAQQQMLRR